MRIRKPGIFFEPGSGIQDVKIRIRDKHPGYASLIKIYEYDQISIKVLRKFDIIFIPWSCKIF